MYVCMICLKITSSSCLPLMRPALTAASRMKFFASSWQHAGTVNTHVTSLAVTFALTISSKAA